MIYKNPRGNLLRGGNLRILLSYQLLCCTVLLMSTSGCNGDGLHRVIVQGTVTLQDKPIEEGQIRYIPQQDTPGPITIAEIHDGTYVCDRNGGVPVGKHRIEIYAWDPTVPIGGRGTPPRPELAPSKYNSESTLVENIDDIGGPVVKDFKLSS